MRDFYWLKSFFVLLSFILLGNNVEANWKNNSIDVNSFKGKKSNRPKFTNSLPEGINDEWSNNLLDESGNKINFEDGPNNSTNRLHYKEKNSRRNMNYEKYYGEFIFILPAMLTLTDMMILL